jgi:hypothetical protein
LNVSRQTGVARYLIVTHSAAAGADMPAKLTATPTVCAKRIMSNSIIIDARSRNLNPKRLAFSNAATQFRPYAPSPVHSRVRLPIGRGSVARLFGLTLDCDQANGLRSPQHGSRGHRQVRDGCPGASGRGAPNRRLERALGPANALAVRAADRRRTHKLAPFPMGLLSRLPHRAGY